MSAHFNVMDNFLPVEDSLLEVSSHLHARPTSLGKKKKRKTALVVDSHGQRDSENLNADYFPYLEVKSIRQKKKRENIEKFFETSLVHTNKLHTWLIKFDVVNASRYCSDMFTTL